MEQTVKEIISNTQKSMAAMAYCDYIAHLISKEIKELDTKYYSLLSSVGRPLYDLGLYGEFASTKKTIAVEDRYGKKYRITIEEA